MKELIIYSKDWKQIKDLRDILKAFYNPTIILQGRKYPTLSLVLPLIKQIYTILVDLNQLYSDEKDLGEEGGVSILNISFYFF